MGRRNTTDKAAAFRPNWESYPLWSNSLIVAGLERFDYFEDDKHLQLQVLRDFWNASGQKGLYKALTERVGGPIPFFEKILAGTVGLTQEISRANYERIAQIFLNPPNLDKYAYSLTASSDEWVNFLPKAELLSVASEVEKIRADLEREYTEFHKDRVHQVLSDPVFASLNAGNLKSLRQDRADYNWIRTIYVARKLGPEVREQMVHWSTAYSGIYGSVPVFTADGAPSINPRPIDLIKAEYGCPAPAERVCASLRCRIIRVRNLFKANRT